MRFASWTSNNSVCAVIVWLIAALALACSDRSPAVIERVELSPNDNPVAPLAGKLELEANEPVTISLEVDDGEEQWTLSPGGELQTTHRVPVVGLRAGKRHVIRVRAVDAAGNEALSDELEFDAVSVPDEFPELELVHNDVDRMEPGYKLIELLRWPEEGPDEEYGLIAIVDNQGSVVWYYEVDHGVEDVRMLANGNIMYMSGRSNSRAFEVDVLGNVVRQWHTNTTPEISGESHLVDVDSFHHEIQPMPNGNFLVLSSAVRTFDDYPSSDTDPDAPRERAHAVDDVLVEFEPDGNVVREWSLMDVLDPHRIAYNSINSGGFWREVYPEEFEEGLNDWAHTNGVFYDEKSDAFVYSVRHQDALVKRDGQSGDVVWILGPHENWREPWSAYLLTPKGELEWQYHQHSPEVTPSGTILAFDNGTHRASAFETKMPLADSYSRVVEFRVDEDAMEVEQVWSYGGREGERFFSSFLSDVDRLPETGNAHVTDGARRSDAEGKQMSEPGPGVHRWARVFEVTHTSPAEIVFELHVKGEPPMGWHVYRSEHIASLYSP